MITLELVGANDWERWRDMRLNALRESPEAFCSSLSDWEHQSEETWRGRLTDVPVNFIAVLDGKDAGMVSVDLPVDETELIGMWVAPFARGQGVGDELVNAVVDWSLIQKRSRLTLRVLLGNDRAATLYERHGFKFEGRQSKTEDETDRIMVHVSSSFRSDHARTMPVSEYDKIQTQKIGS
jgi:RimJ/RimL family protein N-acetyltransferase